jgi:predicted aspartyl protease
MRKCKKCSLILPLAIFVFLIGCSSTTTLRRTPICDSMDLGTYLESITYIAVPISRAPSGHLLIDATVNGIEARFILDTGAGFTTFEITKNEKFNLALTVSDSRATGIGGDVELSKAKVANLTIADFVMNDINAGFIDLRHVISTFAMMGIDIDGVIGADVLSRGEAILDYTNLTLYLRQTPPRRNRPTELISFIKNKEYVAIPLNKIEQGHKYLIITINDVPARIILDTGASHTIMDTERSEKFNLIVAGLASINNEQHCSSTIEARSIGVGDDAPHSAISISTAKCFALTNEYILNDIMMLLISLNHVNSRFVEFGIEEFDGVIGADILANGNAIIDYKNLMLYLKQ